MGVNESASVGQKLPLVGAERHMSVHRLIVHLHRIGCAIDANIEKPACVSAWTIRTMSNDPMPSNILINEDMLFDLNLVSSYCHEGYQEGFFVRFNSVQEDRDWVLFVEMRAISARAIRRKYMAVRP